MRVLVVGAGAREHAIVRGLVADDDVSEVIAAPGNPGIAEDATNHPVAADDVPGLVALAQAEQVDLVVVGPEAPLVAGLADQLAAAGVACCGPSAAAAKLEGSKEFAKQVMAAAGVPTAACRMCSDEAAVVAAMDEFGAPFVVKADGLAGGKGVIVTDDRDAALAHARKYLAKSAVLVEEFLDGPEFSVFCLVDGDTVVALPAAQDYKRVGDGGAGPNTGGMGAISPVPFVADDVVADVVRLVAQPTVDAMRAQGTPFVGVLYCGLAMTSAGIKVVEFNVRFGDPDGNVTLARVASPLGGLLMACARGELADQPAIQVRDEAAVTVVLASENYPGTPVTGRSITGGVADRDGSYVLHAGTAIDGDQLLSSGGRVLSTVGLARDADAARLAAYSHVADISLEGGHFRTDIGSQSR